MTRVPCAVLFALLLANCATVLAVTVVPLNDTGQSLCYDGAGATVSCASSGLDDGRYGRDGANSSGLLSKIGAGVAGFDFTKIANSGSVLAVGAALGSNPADWACTQDNVNSLTWEVKTTSGLRSNAYTYTWYSTDTASNGGDAGGLGTNTCGGTLSSYSNQCNTANYVAAVNAATLCGHGDWRLPSLRELQSLVDFSVPATGAGATIDVNFFPHTQFNPVNGFWVANNQSSYPVNAYQVKFFNGMSGNGAKAVGNYVRLVRGGQ